jgi:hypothetical protein
VRRRGGASWELKVCPIYMNIGVSIPIIGMHPTGAYTPTSLPYIETEWFIVQTYSRQNCVRSGGDT